MSEFEILKINCNYEIEKHYPHRIRKIGKNRFLSESEDSKGYLRVNLHGKYSLKHRLIAFQWINNDDPENKTQIDHINRIKTDNRIENLRWCTHQENLENRNPYRLQKSEFLDEFPEHTIEISEYNGHDFEELYFDILDNRILKVLNSGRLKVIKPYLHGNVLRICVIDIIGKKRLIGYHKLIRTCKELALELEDIHQNEDVDDKDIDIYKKY